MYRNNNHYLADIVTTEHLQKNQYQKCSCSDSLTDVLRVVCCKVSLVPRFNKKMRKGERLIKNLSCEKMS